MMSLKVTTLVLSLAGAAPPPPTPAPAPAVTAPELQALQDRVAELERKLAAAPPGAPSPEAQEQARELARVVVKTEGLEDARDAAGLKGFKVSGYVDPAYVYNRNLQKAGFQLLIPVGLDQRFTGYTYYNSNFGTAMLDLQKEMDGGTRWRLTLMPARSTSDVFAEGGIVHEATVSVPLSDNQTRLIAGQMPDWSGYELLPAPQNKLVTHNLLFDYTLPIAYTGVGLELTRGPFVVKAMVANMSGSHRRDGEFIPVLAYRVDYSGGEYWGLGLAGTHGFATNWKELGAQGGSGIEGPDTRVDVLEVDGYYTRGELTLDFQVGIGRQAGAAVTPDPDTGERRQAQWLGASVLAAYKFTPRFEGVVRADYLTNRKNGGGLLTYPFADPRNGIGPAYAGDPLRGDPEVGADRWAVSLGVNFLYNANVVFKAEARLDGATQPVFGRYPIDDRDPTLTTDFTSTNQVLASSVVVSF